MDEDMIQKVVENKLLHWWGVIRWFIIVVLFAIGMLRITQITQIYPMLVFLAVFFGIVVLNLLFHIQILKQNRFMTVVQIVLDIVFATLVVHLTGGLESSFVWIYLVSVITASLTVEKTGGILSGLIGSMALLGLIMMYNLGILTPTTMVPYDSSTLIIYIISYTGLFAGVAFIANFIGDMVKELNKKSTAYQTRIAQMESTIQDMQNQLEQKNKDQVRLTTLTSYAESVAHLEHELNTPLCVISLSLSRVKRAAVEYNSENLSKSSNEISEALNKITEILKQVGRLRKMDDPNVEKERQYYEV